MKRLLLLTGLVCFSIPIHAQEVISEDSFDERHSSTAVSGINGKLSVGYSYVDNGRPDLFTFTPPFLNTIDPSNAVTFEFPNINEYQGGFVEGSISFPIGERYGFQADGIYSRQSTNLNIDSNIFGVGSHLFWRDPDKGLLGLYGQYVDYDNDLSGYQIGAEAEVYRDSLSLELFAGLEGFDFDFGPLVLKDNQNFFAGEAVFAYYPDENFRLSGGVAHNFEETRFVTGFEWQFNNNKAAPTIFVDAEFGEDITAVRAGVSLYFGQKQKSLVRRHREDDPQNRLLNSYASLEGCIGRLFDQTTLNVLRPVKSPVTGLPSAVAFEPFAKTNGCEARPTFSNRGPSIDNPFGDGAGIPVTQ